MSKAKITIPEEKLKLYDALISTRSDIERKGKTTPYTSLNGHMFSFLSKEGVMGLRLSQTDRDTFIQEHASALMEQHGRVVKEYVVIPDELLKDTQTMEKYLAQSRDYIATLKPKPTKR